MEMKTRELSSLRQGERARVVEMGVPGGLGKRLEDMGMIPGTEVSCRIRMPGAALGAYELRGTVIALRKCDARLIAVGAVQ